MMLQGNCTQEEWVVRGALCELLAKSLKLPTRELAEALVSGEFGEAFVEIGESVGIDPSILAQSQQRLAEYQGQDSEELFHNLRIEYTRLFVGAPNPVVWPYAGVWHALEQGVEPLMFVNPRTIEIERFMKSCGIGQSEGRNEPLDHIATEFEFLQYLALVNAGAILVSEGVDMSDDAFGSFLSRYVASWAGGLAQKVLKATKSAFYQAVAQFVQVLL